MNHTVLWRLVWKEYRMQRAFWIAMAVLTLLVELLVLAFVRAGPDRVTWLFTIGLALPAFYALGCGATLFATEHETGTYEFQRALPVSAIRLFGGKLAFAVVSIVAMIGLLWLLSAVMAGWRFPSPAEHLQLWDLWGMAAAELLLWGIFFSLLIARPLLTAILAATLASVTVQCTLGTISPNYYLEPYLAAVPYRAAIAAALALLDVLLGYAWFHELDGFPGGAAPLYRLARVARRRWGIPFMFILALLAVAVSGGWFSTAQRPLALAACLWAFMSVEVFVWAMLLVLLLNRSVNLTVLLVSVASFAVHFGAAKTALTDAVYHLIVPVRLPMVAVVALADLLLAYRQRQVSAVGRGAAAEIAPVALPPRGAVLGRLLWHQWRQSVWAMAALGVLLLPVLLTVVSRWGHLSREGELLALLAMVAVPLMGACVFHADQRGHGFRFFAERDVRPGYFWLSRHLVWLAALLFWTVLMCIAVLGVLDPPARQPQYAATVCGYVLGFAILGYTAGQLFSMLLGSGILAGFFSLVLSAVLFGWAALMLFLQIPWIWSIAPIPLAFLLATWLRAPDWLLERNTFRAWLGPSLAVILPVAAVLTAVPLYRIYDIPAVGPGFSIEEFTRPATAEEQATFEMYREAGLMYVPMSARKLPSGTDEETAPPEPKADRAAREKAWIEANAEVIALTVKAGRQPACDFFDPRSDLSKAEVLWRCRSLGNLLIASAAQLESEGKLDAALERYLAAIRGSLHLRHRGGWEGADTADCVEREVYDHLTSWAAKPGQTPQRIKGAIRQLAELTQNVRSRSDVIESEYLWTRQLISAYPETLAQKLDIPTHHRFWAALTLQWLPWERARALRVLDFVTARDLESFHQVESAIAQGGKFVLPEDDPESLAIIKLTPFLAAFYWEQGGGQARQLTAMETRRCAVGLLLALQAWKIEHGKLPKTLDEVVGPYLDHLPLDPYAAEPFRYFPQGLPIPITPINWYGSRGEAIEAGRPFIWSTGPAVVVSDRGYQPEERYRIRGGRGGLLRPTSPYDVWQRGWPFPLP